MKKTIASLAFVILLLAATSSFAACGCTACKKDAGKGETAACECCKDKCSCCECCGCCAKGAEETK